MKTAKKHTLINFGILGILPVRQYFRFDSLEAVKEDAVKRAQTD